MTVHEATANNPAGRLILVPTPIGNLGDITYRAVETLQNVDLVACEDTRRAATLFQRYRITTRRISFHAHNEHSRCPSLVRKILDGARVALITDAGSPGISDPGFLLVRACIESSVSVEALPGATAFVPALTASGLPSDRFVFEGFLPARKGRMKRLSALVREDRTIVLYESPHRIAKLLKQIETLFGGETRIVMARELSKRFEEYLRGPVDELRTKLEMDTRIRGEFVVLVAGPGARKSTTEENN